MLNIASELAKRQKVSFRETTARRGERAEVQVDWRAVPPSKFVSRYGGFRVCKDEKGLTDYFANGVGNHKTPLVRDKALRPMFMREWSDSLDYINFQRISSDLFNNSFTPDLDDELFTENGIHRHFDSFRTVAGYPQFPMSWTPIDNAGFRRELGLPDKMTPRQVAIFKETFRLIFKEATVTHVNVAKGSTSGIPIFTTDPQWKLAYSRWIMEPARFDSLFSMLGKNDWVGLRNDYAFCVAAYYNKRLQVDDPGKTRKVFDLLYARSGGIEGHILNANKKVILNGVEIEDFGRMRARVIQGFPFQVTCVLQPIFASHLKSIFERYPKTFHVNTDEDILRIITGREIYCSDVSEYDRTISHEQVSLFHEIMGEFWDERFVSLSEKVSYAPYYARPLTPDGKEGAWVGDIRNPDSKVFAGNRSGDPKTSLMAKAIMTAEMLCVLDKIRPVLGRVEAVLLGGEEFGIINNGDDTIAWFDDSRDYELYSKLRPNLNEGMFVVEREVGNGYSGRLILRKKNRRREYSLQMRYNNAVESIICPEIGFDSKLKAFPAIGQMVKINNLMSTDIGREMIYLLSKAFSDSGLEAKHGTFMEVARRGLAYDENRLLNSLSQEEKTLIVNPDAIHYMGLDENMIRGEVMDQVFAKIPDFQVEFYFNSYYSGHAS